MLLSLPWTPIRDQWYRVSVALHAEHGQIEVNGRRAEFDLPTDLRSGMCGLYARYPTEACMHRAVMTFNDD